MCLVFVAWRAHPRYRLVVAANRDEYHARPTAPAAPWEAEPGPEPSPEPESGPGPGPGPAGPADGGLRPARSPATGAGGAGAVGAALAREAAGEAAHTSPADAGAGAGEGRILAGRDLAAGGAWLGVTTDGRFAALTNYRGSAPPGPDTPSRGRLVADFLRSCLDARGYAREAAREADRYCGFHLLLADRDALLCVTNRGRGGERVTELPAGCHGLANDRLNDPCPRVAGGLPGFRRLLRSEPEDDDLFSLLADDEPAAGAEAPAPGLKRVRSARFVRSPEYGTRSSTVVRIAGNGAIAFEERSFDARARETGRAAFERPAKRMGAPSWRLRNDRPRDRRQPVEIAPCPGPAVDPGGRVRDGS